MPLDVPTETLADKLVEVIQTNWNPSAPSEVAWEYDPPITEDTVSKLTGRKVWILPKTYKIGPDTRGRNQYLHGINVLTVERYGDSGLPPKAWIQERTLFVYTEVVKRLDYAKGGQLLFDGRAVRTTEIGQVDLCLIEYLTGHMLFWSEVPFEFAEELA